MKTYLYLLSSIWGCLISTKGDVVNGGFEDAVLVQYQGQSTQVRASEALAGWTASFDIFVPSPSEFIIYNNIALDSPAVSIHDANSLFKPLLGSFSVYLQGGTVAGTQGASIFQTTTVPSDARSLMFLGRNVSNLEFSFDGQVLPILPLSTLLPPEQGSVYGVDVSSFAGTLRELRFRAPAQAGIGLIDSIFFSSQAVPETSTLALGVVGLAFLLPSLRRRN